MGESTLAQKENLNSHKILCWSSYTKRIFHFFPQTKKDQSKKEQKSQRKNKKVECFFSFKETKDSYGYMNLWLKKFKNVLKSKFQKRFLVKSTFSCGIFFHILIDSYAKNLVFDLPVFSGIG